jgi:hypothetical protein
VTAARNENLFVAKRAADIFGRHWQEIWAAQSMNYHGLCIFAELRMSVVPRTHRDAKIFVAGQSRAQGNGAGPPIAEVQL